MTTLAEFVSAAEARGATVRRERDQYLVSCPLHEDKTPSLHAGDRNGKLLLKAFCCDGEFTELLEAFGLGNGNGNGHAPRTAFHRRTKETEPADQAWEATATYDYLDADGNPLYRKVRQSGSSGGKRFTREPAGAKSSLYHLEMLQHVEGGVLFVSESEKDADAILSCSKNDLIAVSSGGASSWRDAWTDAIATAKPRLVAICEHADEPGRKFARAKVAPALAAKGLSVRVLGFGGENAPKGYDVADALRDGLDIDELYHRAEAEPEWSPTTSADDGLAFIQLGDLLAMEKQNTSWVWEGRIPSGGLAGLFAKPKGGKSTLARCLALAVSRGEPLLGFSSAPGPVLYLGLEEKASEVQAHFQSLGATPDDPIYCLIAIAPADGLARLRVDIERIRPVLVIIDTISRLVRLKDGNDYAEVSRELEPVLALARETGAAVLFCHHLGKGERSDAGDSILGSTAIFAAVDTALLLKRSERFRTLSSIQRYGDDLEEITLALDPETREISHGGTRQEADDERYSREILAALGAVENPLTKDTIFEEVEGRSTDKLRVLKRLVAAGTVFRSGNGKKGDPYLYRSKNAVPPFPEKASFPFPPLHTNMGTE